MQLRYSHLFFTLLLLHLVLLDARGQDLPRAVPEEVGMSSERLERLSQRASEFVEKERLAGVMSLVARHGKVVYLDAVGWQDKEGKVPMKCDTIFRRDRVSVASRYRYT